MHNMHKKKDGTGINCPKFQKQESVTKDIMNKIKRADTIQSKAGYAEEFQKEADILLNCRDYSRENLDCIVCRQITNLRRQTTDLIIKAEKLA